MTILNLAEGVKKRRRKMEEESGRAGEGLQEEKERDYLSVEEGSSLIGR